MPKPAPKKIIVAYVPVFHRGYLQFFEDQAAEEIYVIGPDLLKKIDYLRKDLRALTPAQAANILKKAGIADGVGVLTAARARQLDQDHVRVVAPDEDISHAVAKLFKKAKVQFLPVFLRWDRRSLESAALADPAEKLSNRKIDKRYLAQAYDAARSSSDIWRRVGAVLIGQNGKQIGVASNQAEPNQHSPWMEGDPRNIFHHGVGVNVAVFMHAEAALIAKAAKDGTSLKGASMYTTTFPCPWCAKLVAHSGISNLYYGEGYGVLDAKRVLDDYAVKLRRVPLNAPADQENSATWVPYKKNS
jgi:dCMP deaminase